MSNDHPQSFFTREQTLLLLRGGKFLGDFFCLNLAFLGAYFIKVGWIMSSDLKLSDYYEAALIGIIFHLFCQIFFGLYHLKFIKRRQSFLAFLVGGLVGIAALNNFFFFQHQSFFSREISLLSFALSFALLVSNDYIFRQIEKKLISLRKISWRTLFLGVNRETEKIINKIKEDSFREILPIAILDARGSSQKEVCGIPVLGKLDKLEKVAREKNIEAIFLCDHLEHTFNIVSFAEGNFLELFIAPSVLGIYSERTAITKISKLSFLTLRKTKLFAWKKLTKDLLDFAGSFSGLILFSPFFLLFTLLNKIINQKIFSKEIRIGREGREITMYRFFTGELIKTPNGESSFSWRYGEAPNAWSHFLRRTFLSELPQLLNVLKGEMSLIGPRPPYPEEFAAYQAYFKRRVSVKPGILGIWQNKVARLEEDLNFKKMIEDDLNYVSNWSLALDFRILFNSIQAVFTRRSRKS